MNESLYTRLGVYPFEDELYRGNDTLELDAREELLHSAELESIIGEQAEQLAAYGFARESISAEDHKIVVGFMNKYTSKGICVIIIYSNKIVVEMSPILTGYGDMDDITRVYSGLARLLRKYKKVKRRLHETKEEILRLREENAHLRLLPDAPDYLAAKAHFERLAE